MQNTLLPKFSKALAIALVCCGSAATATPVLQVENGILVGAKNVVVNGAEYDVTFKGNSCTEAFGTCDPAAFFFRDFDTALAASKALIDQVFINGPDGDFDRYSSLTNGCQAYQYYCVVLTPVDMGDNVVTATGLTNYSGRSRSDVGGKFYLYADRAWVYQTYARWTAAAGEVPEPGSVALLTVGLVGISVQRRRR